MSDKIIRLESLFLIEHCHGRNDGGIDLTRMIEVGHPYDEPHFKPDYDRPYEEFVECHSDRDVVSIDLNRDSYYSDGGCYVVRLKDGNKLYLPINAFIAETKEIIDNW